MIMKKHTSRRVRCWPQCPSKGNAGSEDGDVNEMAMDHRYLRQSESSPFCWYMVWKQKERNSTWRVKK